MSSSVRVDTWLFSVRVCKTRSEAAAACRGGRVRVNGDSAKPSHPLRVGDEVVVRQPGRERIVEVTQLVAKRVGPPLVAECLIDRSPPPPPREVLATLPRRDRGSGRPTKRERRELDKLRGL